MEAELRIFELQHTLKEGDEDPSDDGGADDSGAGGSGEGPW